MDSNELFIKSFICKGSTSINFKSDKSHTHTYGNIIKKNIGIKATYERLNYK